jgi:hypothetical protein
MAPKHEGAVYAWISIQNGTNVNPNGGSIEYGQQFFWANPVAGKTVTINGCGGFCVDSAYTVGPPPAGQAYGLASATVLPQNQVTSWEFGPEVPNQWNAPGMPKIINPPFPSPKEKEEGKVA